MVSFSAGQPFVPGSQGRSPEMIQLQPIRRHSVVSESAKSYLAMRFERTSFTRRASHSSVKANTRSSAYRYIYFPLSQVIVAQEASPFLQVSRQMTVSFARKSHLNVVTWGQSVSSVNGSQTRQGRGRHIWRRPAASADSVR